MFRLLFSPRGGRVLGLAALALVLSAGAAIAQAGRIEGTVRNAQTRDPLPNARITIVGTNLFGITNENGYYAIENVPVGTYDLRAQIIGYQSVIFTNQRVATNLPATANFQLAPSILRIEGVVVTGVAEATQAVKLPFTVDKVSGQDLPVPAQNPEETLRGKVAGARVVRGSGLPGSGTSVLLRGATSINTSGRSNEPLYVVDGVILGASMVDIDALDIESVEVVKGAAAAALYGARAANGVIQISTRRGQDIPDGETRITIRSEFGRNQLQKDFPITQRHFYRTDGTNWLDEDGSPILTADTTFAADGSIQINQDNTLAIITPRDKRVVDWITGTSDFDGDGTATEHRYAVSDNVYPSRLFNHMERFFDPGSFYTNSLNVSHRTGNTNFLASFHETKESGVVDGLDGYIRRGGRVNVDHRIGRQLDFGASAMYSQSVADDPFGGPNPFFTLPRLEPDIDLLQRYPAAQAKVDAGIATARDSNDYLLIPDTQLLEENPIYSARNADQEESRGRFLASIGLRWRPTSEFDVEGNFSIDRSDRNTSNFWFKGYRTFDASVLRTGRLTKVNSFNQAMNASITAAYTKRFGDLNTVTKARVLVERAKNESATARATELVVDRVKDLDNSNTDLQRVFGSTSEVRSLGYLFSSQLDFKDRYIIDAALRRDGSSLFGPEERWNWYYRIGGAYRMAEESWWPFQAIDEFKLRFSRGTAGGRPSFSAQYETYSIGGGTVSKGNLGNKFLKPELATEDEFGVDMVALGRLSLSVSYARTTNEDQILLVPLAGFNGFSNQWRNAGTLKTNTWEATLQAAIIQTPDMSWNANFVIDRTRGKITELNVPPFFTGGGWFYVRRGDDVGTIYGQGWATSCNDVLTDGGFGVACDQFQVNDDGYLVPVGVGNTWTDGIDKNYYGAKITIDGVTFDWGMPVKKHAIRVDTLPGGQIATDTTTFQKIGNSIPDFNFGIGNTFRYKGFSVYTLFDAQIGGDIYNNTRQWGCRDKTCWEYDQETQDGTFSSGAPGQPENTKKSILYGELLYDVNDIGSHFVEDGTFLKFRELALRYTFNRSQLEGIFGNFVNRLSISLIGRNLITWSDYSGYDPEVSSQGGASAYLRVDEFGYPNYRTWTGSIEIEF